MPSLNPALHERLRAIRLDAAKILLPTPKPDSFEQSVLDGLARARAVEAPRTAKTLLRDTQGPWLHLEPPRAGGATIGIGPSSSAAAARTTSFFTLGDAAVPLIFAPRLAHAASACLGELHLGLWSAEAFGLARARYGEANLGVAWTMGILDVLLLRRDVKDAADRATQTLAAKLLETLDKLLVQMPEGILSTRVRPVGGGFMGTLVAQAARLLDGPALARLSARMPFVTGDPFARPPGHIGISTLFAWTAVCLESPHWRPGSDDGVAAIEAIVALIDGVYARLPWGAAQEARDGIMRILIKSRRLELLPMVAQEDAAVQVRMPLGLSAYVTWAAQDGWAEGVLRLVDLGIDANARKPGVNICHTSFSAGATPLMAVLTSGALSDAASVQLCCQLIERGAHVNAAACTGFSGVSLPDFYSAKELAQRLGLGRRWELLAKFIPPPDEAQFNVAHQRVNDAVAKMLAVADAIDADLKQVSVDALMRAVHSAHDVSLKDYPFYRLFLAPLQRFIAASGGLFYEQYQHLGPFRSQPTSDGPSAPFVFSGLTYALEPGTLCARMQHWAREVRAVPALLAAQLQQDTEPELGPNTPSHWLAELAHLLRGGGSQAYGLAMALQVLRGQSAAARHMLEAEAAPAPKELGLTFWMAVDAAAPPCDGGEAQARRTLAQAIIRRCDTLEAVRALTEIALRTNLPQWIDEVLDHVTTCRFDLRRADEQSAETLLHIAAESPHKALKVFCAKVPPAWRLVWLSRHDDAGDTPLHRAARVGLTQVKALLEGLDASEVRARVTLLNGADQSPALVALQHNQPKTFAYLSGLQGGQGSAQALGDALAARRGGIAPAVLATLMGHPQTAALICAEAPSLGRRLARLGDLESFATLMQQVGQQMLNQKAATSTVLHAVAQGDAEDIMAHLMAHASVGQLRALAGHKDRRGKYAEDYARSPQLRQQLQALRGVQRPTQAVPAPQINRWHALYTLARQVAQANTSGVLEDCIAAFCARAEADLKNNKETGANEIVQRLAWQVVSHIDRAPLGIQARMGLHLAMHRPEVSLDVLKKRAATTQTGASRFAKDGGLALLRGRSEAFRKARGLGLSVGMRAVVEVPCMGLGGSGFVTRSGNISPLLGGETLRTVFAQTPQGLLLVTAYAV